MGNLRRAWEGRAQELSQCRPRPWGPPAQGRRPGCEPGQTPPPGGCLDPACRMRPPQAPGLLRVHRADPGPTPRLGTGLRPCSARARGRDAWPGPREQGGLGPAHGSGWQGPGSCAPPHGGGLLGLSFQVVGKTKIDSAITPDTSVGRALWEEMSQRWTDGLSAHKCPSRGCQEGRQEGHGADWGGPPAQVTHCSGLSR